MRCEEILNILNEYVDGNASIEICQEFEAHLSGCHPCQVVVDNVRNTIQLYKDGKPYPLPDGFHERLRSALRRCWDRRLTK
jgi:anti-sigma factor RsiW